MIKLAPMDLAQSIVRGNDINVSYNGPYGSISSIYRFTNEDITSYFHHLANKKKVLTVIGSGSQILNGILAGTQDFDCFDISIFPEYYLNLQIASILALSKEDYLKYYFSSDREEAFNDELYDKISLYLKGKYKEFWDYLYMFNDGYEISESLLFRQDVCLQNLVIENNPYLQDKNYEKVKNNLKYNAFKINPQVCNVVTTKFSNEYDLINLSNILTYYFKKTEDYIEYLKNNFKLVDNGEIINYIFSLRKSTEEKLLSLLNGHGYIENLGEKRLLVFKK